MGNVAVLEPQEQPVSRPLKILIPLIQEELEQGTRAGVEHYRKAGIMLLQARPQVAAYKWGTWLSKNFHLGSKTAYDYMALAEMDFTSLKNKSMSDLLGYTAKQKKARNKTRKRLKILDDLDKLNTNEFTPKKKTAEEEMKLHRELAGELVDIGYRALATRLHPDHGGNKDAMRRLNRVRDELKSLANTRRFV